MRHFIAILTIITASSAFGQIQTGTYRQGDSLWHADMKIYANHKFSFYDTRQSSCWFWSKYEGKWTLEKDTLTCSWKSLFQEKAVEETKAIDT